MNPTQKLHDRQKKLHSLLCVGLDSDIAKIPHRFHSLKYPQFEFNKWIIDQTHEYVCAYKPNIAFYEARGDQGIKELKMTAEYLQENHPDIFTICDAKRADIGNTNEGYVKSIFDWYGFDAVTLNPYLGREAIQPFLDRKDKVSIILCKTSNPGGGEIQDVQVRHPEPDNESMAKSKGEESSNSGSASVPLWQLIAYKVAREWNENDNCMLVVGATYPEQLAQVRQIIGTMDILVPGVGSQGGDLQQTLDAGLTPGKKGLIISISRSIIFAKDPGIEIKNVKGGNI